MSGHNEIEIPDDVELKGLPTKLPVIGLVVAVVGFGLAFAGDKHHTPFALLFGTMATLSIALGCLIFVLLQHVVRAGWSASLRRLGEVGAATLMVLPVLLVGIALVYGHDLFPWQDENHLDAVLVKKKGYLNASFLWIRTVGYWVVWAGLGYLLWNWSSKQDKLSPAEAAPITKRLWALSSVGIPLYAFSQTFGAFDFLMSLQPHWYSTMFGVYFFAGSIIGAYAFLTLMVMFLQKAGVMVKAFNVEHFHDLGKFIFGHTIFWAYIAFSQFFLIWYANIPEETEFFVHRTHHGWATISYALPIIHFFLPFFFLLSRHIKRNPKTLAIGAIYMFVMHLVDLYWLVIPNVGAHGHGEAIHAFSGIHMDVGGFLGPFGLFLAVYGFLLGRNKVVAVGDPRLTESLQHENY